MAGINKKLVLETGEEFPGTGFGADTESICQLVFCTSMAGYQEIVSDPSHTYQTVVMTYPVIGNYGITDEDFETKIPTIGGLVVREYNDSPSNFRYTRTLSEILEENKIPGISGVDTRMITRIIRERGSQRAIITGADTPREEAMRRISGHTPPAELLSLVSCKKKWYSRTPNHVFSVVAVDCGIKLSAVRMLNARGCNVTVVPYNTPAPEILALRPDGLLISNGPGKPEEAKPVTELIKTLKGRLPIFGIGLGHLLIALACGADIYELKTGHMGGHPVLNLKTGKIEITSQGHGFAVSPDSLAGTSLTVTHKNLLDGSIEGMECREHSLFSVQYNPESAPGAQDSYYLFDTFTEYMSEFTVKVPSLSARAGN